MPAEWSPHYGTWLSWPTNEITWPDRLEQVEEVYLDMIEALSTGEQVLLLVDDEETQSSVRNRLKKRGVALEHVTTFVIPTVDGWIRDYGPNFVQRHSSRGIELAYNHWGFNAWGDKYDDLKADGALPRLLSPLLDIAVFEPGIVLEGGSIDVNGQGLCLTTRQCLLNENRNPALSQSDIEAFLECYLGVERTIWLGDGIEGDDTDGHVDDIVRFVAPEVIVCAVEYDPTDSNYAPLQANLKYLEGLSEAESLFRVVELPMPDPIYAGSDRLPASYANFLIANNAILMPAFGQKKDRDAAAVLQEVITDRKVVAIDCRDLIWGMGAVHCLSQQQPQGYSRLSAPQETR